MKASRLSFALDGLDCRNTLTVRHLPVLLTDLNSIHIDSILEPSLILSNLHVVRAVLPLLHEAVLRERPVLETIRPPPLARGIIPLVPELDGDLYTKSVSVIIHVAALSPSEGKESGEAGAHTLLSLKANNSFLSR